MADETQTPCRECPFSKSTMPGWIGGYDEPADLHRLVSNEVRMPCHLTIEYDDVSEGDVAQQERRAPTCVGYLAYANNTAKLFRDRRLRIEAEAVGKRDGVFASPQELVKFHERRR